jgi:hypothetical protein
MPNIEITYGHFYEWPLTAWCIVVGALALLDIGQRAAVRIVTRGMTPTGPMGIGEALRGVPMAAPRLWRWYMW